MRFNKMGRFSAETIPLFKRIRQKERRLRQVRLPVKIEGPLLTLGTNIQTNCEVQLVQKLLEENHVHIIGATRTGKTRLMRHIATDLAQDPNATIILMNPKGSFGRDTRDDLIKMGMTDRLVVLDPNDHMRGISIGYDFLRPNGLPVAVHAKAVREVLRAGFGQANFDNTAQLARWLYLSICASRSLNLTLVEALQILYPNSPIRKALLPRIEDPFVKGALTYLDSLDEGRQDQLLAPTIARLEAFVTDETIRHIIGQQRHSIDISDVIANKQVLIVNLEQNRPLRFDDVKLLGRLIVNDVIAKVFERDPRQAHHPVYLLIDEVQTFLTADLCRILDQGHEVGLHLLVAHQYMKQLDLEDGNDILRESVLNDASVKIVFRLNSTADAKFFGRELFFGQFSPWMVKDEITGLELEPVEETRASRTRGRSASRGRGLAMPQSIAEGESEAATHSESSGESFGEQKTRGVSTTRGRSHTVANSIAHTEANSVAHTEMNGSAHTRMASASHITGHGQAFGTMDAHGAGSVVADSIGTTMSGDPSAPFAGPPDVLTTSNQHLVSNSANDVHADSFSESELEADGVSYSEADTESHAEADTVSHTEADTAGHTEADSVSESETETESEGESHTHSEETSESITQGRNRTVTKGVTPSVSEGESWTESETAQPYTSYIKHRVVTSRTFLPEEEQVTLVAQKIYNLPKGHFVLKLPTKPAIFVRAPIVPNPQLTDEEREAALGRIYAQPIYTPVMEIEAEERERIQQITAVPPLLDLDTEVVKGKSRRKRRRVSIPKRLPASSATTTKRNPYE